MREFFWSREFLVGAILGILISLFLIWRLTIYIPGEMIPLPEIFAPFFNA